MTFLLASQNMPFAFAMGLMLFIAILEGVGLVLGMGISSLLDSVVPDFDFDADIELPEVGSSSGLTSILGWLRIGEVPILVMLVVFLTAFAIEGYGIQLAFFSALGWLLPGPIASVLALTGCLPLVRVLNGIIGSLVPKDESSAVSQSSFIGRTATIIIGTARHASPVQARLTDQYGKGHYVMVAPDNVDEEFGEGAQVLLIKKEGAMFRVIHDTTSNVVKQ